MRTSDERSFLEVGLSTRCRPPSSSANLKVQLPISTQYIFGATLDRPGEKIYLKTLFAETAEVTYSLSINLGVGMFMTSKATVRSSC
jgi:hypothetical protein